MVNVSDDVIYCFPEISVPNQDNSGFTKWMFCSEVKELRVARRIKAIMHV